jgi:toxin ParE1/3/4
MILRINPIVVQDLKAIKAYIGEDNPEAAIKTIEAIYERFENLTAFPGIGSELSKRVSFPTDYKYIIYGEYITLYKVDEEFVCIYRVLNRRQDITSALFYE